MAAASALLRAGLALVPAAGSATAMFTGLGVLSGTTSSVARDVSGDGSTIVGSADSGTELEAFRWTASGGMTGLGLLPGLNQSRAEAVSADGSVVVGRAGNTPSTYEAFVWDSAHGMRSLAQVLTAQGVDLTGWRIDQAAGISADGRTIVGYGTHPNGDQEAWVAVLPEPGTDALLVTGLPGLAGTRRRRGAPA